MNFWENEIYQKDLDIALGQVINIKKLFNSKIMITGATGLIGSYLADMLMLADKKFNAGITIYAVGRNIHRLEQRFAKQRGEQLKLIEQDVTAEIKFDYDVDYIIHAASNAYPASFNKDPVGTIEGNIIGAKNLLEYGELHNIKRLVYISSGEIYGQGDITMDSFSEDYAGYVNPLEPRSCYPMSKRATENLCVSYSKQYNLNTVIARPCHTYGPNTTTVDDRASAQFINDVLDDRNIIMRSTGTQMRSYCYIADCASAILTVMINGKCGEAYNIAFNKSCLTITEFAEIVAKISGKEVVYEISNEIDEPLQSPINKQVLSSIKLEGLGWKGSYTPEIGINHTLEILMNLYSKS